MQIKFTTKPLPPLKTIQATDNEIIILQAALHHYQDFLRHDPKLHQQASPLIQNFIQRLRDQLSLRRVEEQ